MAKGWRRIVPLFGYGLVLLGCQAGVNEELVATPTPYLVRSPIAPEAQGTPRNGDASLTDALATGEAGLGAGDPAAATAYSEAIVRDPSLVPAFIGRGLVAMGQAQGDPATYQRALDDLNRALSLEPASIPARIGRARVYLDRFRFRGDPTDLDRARTELDVVLAKGPSEEAQLLLVRVHVAAGDLVEARRVLDAPVVRRVNGDSASESERAIARATVALAGRQSAEAVTAAMAALDAAPASIEANRLLAEAHLLDDDPEAALNAADDLLARREDDGPALFLRAAALARLGQSAEAERATALARERLAASPVYLARIAQMSVSLAPAATP